MQTRRFTRLPGLVLAVMLMPLVGQAPVFGGEAGEEEAELNPLVGTWDVTAKFPICDAICTCPGGVPDIPIPALHQYQRHGALLEIGGGSPFRGPAVGAWEPDGDDQFVARYKFFLFNPDGSRRGSEEVTNHIRLTGPDAFTATATFDLFDTAGELTAQGCLINATATRFK
jgi:hypothetical protein